MRNDDLFSESTVKAPLLWGFSSEGRMGRLTYANALMLTQSFMLLLPALLGAGSGLIGMLVGTIIYMSMLFFLLRRIIALRLHDLNVSGKAAILLSILWMVSSPGVAMFLDIISKYLGLEVMSTIAQRWLELLKGGAIINIITTIALVVLPGTKGVNRFGMQPRRGKPIGLIIFILMVAGGLVLWQMGYMDNGLTP